MPDSAHPLSGHQIPRATREKNRKGGTRQTNEKEPSRELNRQRETTQNTPVVDEGKAWRGKKERERGRELDEEGKEEEKNRQGRNEEVARGERHAKPLCLYCLESLQCLCTLANESARYSAFPHVTLRQPRRRSLEGRRRR